MAPVGPIAGPSLQGREDAVEAGGQVAGRRSGEGGVLSHLVGSIGDVDRLGLRSTILATEDSVPETEVQRRAHDDGEVTLPERRGASLRDELGVSAWHDSAAHAVGDDRDPGLLHEAECGRLGAVGPHVGTEDEDRARRLRQQLGHLREVVAVRLDRGGGLAFRGRAAGALAEELVHRHVDEGRAAVR